MKWILVLVMVSATVLSDLLQSHEMKQAGEQSVSARGLVAVTPYHRAAALADSGNRRECRFVLYVHGAGAKRAAELRGAGIRRSVSCWRLCSRSLCFMNRLARGARPVRWLY